jgi:hydroxymethylpyrimidine/phosphomethylpyrimidine kinase
MVAPQQFLQCTRPFRQIVDSVDELTSWRESSLTAIALTIAGSDSSGGAGIEADLKTFSALGVYGACVITALTAQNTRGVFAIHHVPADFIAAQIDAVFADLDVGAVKIGMLANAPAVDAVAAALDRHRARNIVLDPVMVASSGEQLLHADATERLRQLIRRVRVLTPNLPEAAALLGVPLAGDEDAMRAQAQKLLALGAGAVLIKGGHLGGAESVDLLVEAGSSLRLVAPRIETRNTHGTGCTLASAIAAGLAKGLPLEQAAREAKDYVSAAIAAADRLQVGTGRGPLHHFHDWW